MIDEPFFFRPASYLYCIKSHPTYYFCVGISDSVQALWGLIGEIVYLILFNLNGELREVKSFQWNEFISSLDAETYIELLEKSSVRFKKEYKLKDNSICVKRFWLQVVAVGIEDVTDNIKEFLSNPSVFEQEEQEDYMESLEEWKAEEQYVFWWEQSFYMGKEGNVETS